MTDTKAPALIPYRFHADDFWGVTRYENTAKNAYCPPTFYSVEVRLGEHDTENLVLSLARAVGMPEKEAEEIASRFRVYTSPHFSPETPPEF